MRSSSPGVHGSRRRWEKGVGASVALMMGGAETPKNALLGTSATPRAERSSCGAWATAATSVGAG